VMLAFGVLLDLGGLALIGSYLIEGVVKRLGEADQSLLFWYLPLLMIGLICLLIGGVATYWGIRQVRKPGKRSE
jgi:hypothetical protein